MVRLSAAVEARRRELFQFLWRKNVVALAAQPPTVKRRKLIVALGSALLIAWVNGPSGQSVPPLAEVESRFPHSSSLNLQSMVERSALPRQTRKKRGFAILKRPIHAQSHARATGCLGSHAPSPVEKVHSHVSLR